MTEIDPTGWTENSLSAVLAGKLYLLCRNDTIPAKYPRQPILTCPGYETRTPATER